MNSCQKVIVFAKFPKKGYRFWGGPLLPMVLQKKRTGKERTRKGKGL